MFHFEIVAKAVARAIVFLGCVCFFTPALSNSLQCTSLFHASSTARVAEAARRFVPELLLPQRKGIVLDQIKRNDWSDLVLKDDFKKPYGMGRDAKNPLFFFIWNSLPEAKRDLLVLLLHESSKNKKNFRADLNKLLAANRLTIPSSHTFVDVLINEWSDYIKSIDSPLNVIDWLKELNNQLEIGLRDGKVSLNELASSYSFGLRASVAKENWQSVHGTFSLPVQHRDGKDWLGVQGKWFQAELNHTQKKVRVLVPRGLIKRAAWNPIYSEVLQQKIQSGTPPPAAYPAFVASDGHIYLSDGNHRFILDQRGEVWVEMGIPIRTVSLSVSFDALGIPQPSIEKIISFNEGAIDLAELAGADSNSKFFYK